MGFVKPLLAYAMIKSRAPQLKKLLIYVVLYLFIFGVINDFRYELVADNQALYILIKWAFIGVVLLHFWLLVQKVFAIRSDKVNEDKPLELSRNEALKTKSQKIYEKYKKGL